MPSTVRIVVVDDNPVLRMMARHLLAAELDREVDDVTEISSGRELLEMCATEQVGVVLLDLHMPDLDGVEVIRRLARTAGRPYIVAWSADQFALQTALVAGADIAVLKDDVNALVDAVRNHALNSDRPQEG